LLSFPEREGGGGGGERRGKRLVVYFPSGKGRGERVGFFLFLGGREKEGEKEVEVLILSSSLFLKRRG